MPITGQSHGVIKFTSTSQLAGGHTVGYVRWYLSTNGAAGDTVVMTDAAGNEWWRSIADGANFVDLFPINKRVEGPGVTMAKGNFYIYTR